MSSKEEIADLLQRFLDNNLRGQITDAFAETAERNWADVPFDILSRAADRWIAREKFLPTHAEMNQLIVQEFAHIPEAMEQVASYYNAVQRDRGVELLEEGMPSDEVQKIIERWTGEELCTCGAKFIEHVDPLTGLNIFGECERTSCARFELLYTIALVPPVDEQEARRA